MKILHIYPKNDSRLAQYVGLLSKAMTDDVEMLSTDDNKDFLTACHQFRPDIVHMHGHTPFTIPEGTRLVITPHGQQVEHEAYTLIARSPIEYKQLAEHHQRIEVIRDPMITRTTTAQELARQTLGVYRRVMDSNVLELMDDDTLTALSLLLKAGICGDSRWLGNAPAMPSHPDWRKLLIYACHEGISDMLSDGIRVMGINAPTMDAASIPSYLPNNYQKPEPMGRIPLFALIRQIRTECQNDQMLILRLVETHQALMRPDVDERMLMRELESAKMQAFFACLLQLLSEQTRLDEGFMPCEPVNNRTTQRLRTLLKRHLQI